MNITLDQLTVLESIVATGSFTAAARSLNRATSAVSYAIRGLESALEFSLFDRSQRRVKLTPAGERVLHEAREVMRQVHRLEAVAANLRDDWEPRVTVVVDGVLPIPPLMRALRAFDQLGTPTRVHLRMEYLSGVRECFEAVSGDLMVALDLHPEPALSLRQLPPVTMLLLAHHDHPLCLLERAVTREDLASHVELSVPDSGAKPGPVRPLSLGSPNLFQMPDFHSKREALLSGVGFGWLPQHLAREPMAQGQLKLVGYEEGDTHRFMPHLARWGHVAQGRAALLLERLFLEALCETRTGGF